MSGLKELQALIEAQENYAYDQEDFEDAESEFWNEVEERDTRDVAYNFEKIYYGYLKDYEETAKPFVYDFPGIGTINVVDDYDDHIDGHRLFVVFEWNGDLYQYGGWDDSWNGCGGFEGPLERVEAKEISTTVYTVVEDQ